MNTVLINMTIVLFLQWVFLAVPKPVKEGKQKKLPAQRALRELRLEGRMRITDVDLVF